MSDRATILVLRALGLGDFMTGLPALALLRRERPRDRIVLAAPPELAPLARLSGSVDEVVAARELEPIVDPPYRPELAIDLHGNGPESRALLMATSPRQLIAYGCGPVWDRHEHEVRRWIRLVEEGLGVDASTPPSVVGALPVPPRCPVPAGVSIVHCGAKSAARRWPPERFVEVARSLSAAGHDVLVTGGPREAILVELISTLADVPGTCALTLEELCALVASARLVVSGDTGVAHVASNYGTPSVVLFGPVSPAVWGPPALERHQVLWHGTGNGDPHGDVTDPALLAISVDDVVHAVERALTTDEELIG